MVKSTDSYTKLSGLRSSLSPGHNCAPHLISLCFIFLLVEIWIVMVPDTQDCYRRVNSTYKALKIVPAHLSAISYCLFFIYKITTKSPANYLKARA